MKHTIVFSILCINISNLFAEKNILESPHRTHHKTHISTALPNSFIKATSHIASPCILCTSLLYLAYSAFKKQKEQKMQSTQIHVLEEDEPLPFPPSQPMLDYTITPKNPDKIIFKIPPEPLNMRITFNEHELAQYRSDYAYLQELYTEYQIGDVQRIQRRLQALASLDTHGASYSQTYALDTLSTAFLKEADIDAQPYLSCYGNQLQQVIHQECIDVLTQLVSHHIHHSMSIDMLL